LDIGDTKPPQDNEVIQPAIPVSLTLPNMELVENPDIDAGTYQSNWLAIQQTYFFK